MQFNREDNGKLRELPSKHIDTGMGLERLTSVLMNKTSNYDTDLFTYIFDEIQALSTLGRPYAGKIGKEDPEHVDTSYRIIADHIRTLTFAISDGIIPGNDGREYVLRRVLRRAVRYGDKLGCPKQFFNKLVPSVVAKMGHVFPELQKNPERVQAILEKEEIRFLRTYEQGKSRFESTVKKMKGKVISGKDAFELHSTYGFPVDLTIKMALENGLTVDKKGYDKAMDEFKKLSEKEKDSSAGLKLDQFLTTQLSEAQVATTDDSFKYQRGENITSQVLRMYDGQTILTSAERGDCDDDGYTGLILARTNFYAEAGGQIYDTGIIKGAGFEFEVTSVKSSVGYILHIGKIKAGKVKEGDVVELQVDWQRRQPIAVNHSSHVLNFGLRKVLGGEIDQKGSLVLPEKLRFDFNHDGPVSAEKLKDVRDAVLDVASNELKVYSRELKLDVARGIYGLRAVFGETYPDPVKVVSVGADLDEVLADPSNPRWAKYSIEFCGGTHITNSNEIKGFEIINETALGASTRRVECVTGPEAAEANATFEKLRAEIAAAIESQTGEELKRTVAFMNKTLNSPIVLPIYSRAELRQQMEPLYAKQTKEEKELKEKQSQACKDLVESSLKAFEASPPPFLVSLLEAGDHTPGVLGAIKKIQEAHPSVAVLLVSPDHGKDNLMIHANCPKAAQDKGLLASNWTKEVAGALGGKGGGKPGNAAAVAQDCSKAQVALDKAVEIAKQHLTA